MEWRLGDDDSQGPWPKQLLSEYDTAPAQPMATSCHCWWRRDWGKVGMHFDVRKLSLGGNGKEVVSPGLGFFENL